MFYDRRIGGMSSESLNRRPRKQSLAEALRSSNLLSRIVEIADDAILSIDESERIVLSNSGAERIFGYPPGELDGLSLVALLPERYRAAHSAYVGEFAHSAVPSRAMAQRGQIVGLRKNGEEFPAEASISKVDVDGAVVMTVILRDVSDRHAAQRKLSDALEEKEVLLREVHHRVKNNLQIVSSLLALQSRATGDPDVRRAFEESQNRVQSMALIHEQLYESSNLSDVDFPEYVRQLVSRLLRTYQVRQERIELRTEIGDVRLGVDLAVPCGLILNELISNAVKYAFPGGRRGAIVVRVERQPDGSGLLSVADDGIGLPPEVGFWSTKTLGLRLVRSLVRQLDGEIELSGPPGAEFRIRFALGESPQ